MSYPGQQQNWQSSGGYYPYLQNDVDPFARQGSRAVAVFSAILGLGLAGVLTWQTLGIVSKLNGAKGLVEVWNIAHLAVAGIVLIGAVLVFARRIAGAFILSAAALVAFAGLLLAPLVVPDISPLMVTPSTNYIPMSRRSGYDEYFNAVFESGNELAILQLVGVLLAFLVMSIAMLRPSRDWLRRRQDDYSAQQAGW